MIYLAFFIFFIALFMLIYGILCLLNKDKISIGSRVEKLKEFGETLQERLEGKSFFERMIRPFYNSIGKTLLKITPSSKLSALNKRLDRAGLLKNTTAEKWLYTKVMVMIGSSFIVGLLSFMVEPNILKVLLLIALVMVSVNTFFNFYISKTITARKNKILKDLPYTLDLITVSVEAGLSFDGAMARVISNIKGELCEEFSKSLKEVRMGIERKVALKNMSERCGVRELSMFVTSLIQADELGVSLSRVLRIESANLREHRKQAAREKAMKAPIKMLFPLIFFIFPTIFIIILGPAVIRMIKVFGGN